MAAGCRWPSGSGTTTASRAGVRVLDIGCAKGFLLHDLRQVVPGLLVTGLDISSYALANAMEDVRTGLVRWGRPIGFRSRTKLVRRVVSINTVHNLTAGVHPGARGDGAGRPTPPLRPGGFLAERVQREKLERWQLTARTYSDPDGWRAFAEAGYHGDYYWTVTGKRKPGGRDHEDFVDSADLLEIEEALERGFDRDHHEPVDPGQGKRRRTSASTSTRSSSSCNAYGLRHSAQCGGLPPGRKR
jgi:SAM-dependent methyltransferase